MKITELRPERDRGSGSVIARFDLQVTEGLRIFGLQLRQRADGSYRIAAPNLSGRHVATFTPPVAIEITAAAVAAYFGGPHAHDHART